MKRFLALGIALTMISLPYLSSAQIMVEERIYIPEPSKIEIPECDFVKMVNSLSFRIVEKEADGKYYDLVSEKNRDNKHQRFTVELKNCKLEQAEKTEWVNSDFSGVNYKFILASFVLDIDYGKIPDGFNRVLHVLVKVHLDSGPFLSLEEQKFFDKLLKTLRLETLKGIMSYVVLNDETGIFPHSPGQINRLEINIRLSPIGLKMLK